MYASISSGLLLSGGFTGVSDGLKALGIDSIELGIGREYKVISVKPTAEKPDFILSSDSAIEEYKKHLEQNGVKISAIIMGNNFNSPNLEAELSWVIGTIL